ncbi:hypothetical protein F511_09768, partial [Dorcoceras hygrometricum]
CQPKSYIVFVGREPGVYERWSEASKQVCGFRGSCYKGYEIKKDAEEAFRSFSQAPDGTRVHEKCECEKTSTSSTSRPHRSKNSQKLVKVLRDLAIEIHNHAARMEKVVEEIGQILEDIGIVRSTGDMVAKIYCGRRIFVWEFFDGSLKWKIELKWNDIVAINPNLESGILEIMICLPMRNKGCTVKHVLRIRIRPPIAVDTPIRSTTRSEIPSSDCTRSPDEISTIGFSSKKLGQNKFRRSWRRRRRRTAAAVAAAREREGGRLVLGF